MKCYVPYCLDKKDIVGYGEFMLSRYEVSQLPYFDDLNRVVHFFGEYERFFPRGFGAEVSKALHIMTGLEEQSGYYSPAHHDKFRVWNPTSWNRDPERGLLIDLTQFQFVEDLPKILVLQEPNPVLTPDDIMTGYQQRWGTEEMLLEMLRINLL